METLRDGLLVGMGNPLLDISAVVEKDLLAKYDMLPNNAILAEEKHMPIYQELIEKYQAEYIAGGSVQNSLRVAQWILQRPRTAVFFGCVGDDTYARILEQRATSSGVNVQYQQSLTKPTGTCAVLVTGTQRSLCANLAAANDFTLEHLQSDTNKEYLKQAQYFYVSGFFFTVSFESALAVAKDAAATDRMFMMNLSAPFVPQFYKSNLEEIFPFVDVLFGNETEAVTLSKEFNYGTEDLREIGKKLVSLPKQNSQKQRIVIITQGSDPVLLIENEISVREFPVQKLTTAEMVDTNGAGDAFVGGFLAQLLQGRVVDTCIECGIWAAREIIQRSGCTFEGKPAFSASK
ncbi:adenosine kinase [Anopheles nili]|uniref:adenosine kinase n=1 Tax=Anopheles nili TaxID=185578 RepID=UPI00237A0B77|nr:adenosine kinase [Anopheles nili]